MLCERLRPYVEKCIGTYQAGFRRGRSTVDQIFTLRQILEKTREYGMDTSIYHLFIEFKAAYDSVIRSKLYEAIHRRELQIPSKIIKMVRATMARVVCKVKIQDELSEPFETSGGIRQGDGLACLLFNLALEKVIRQSKTNCRTILLKSTQILAYADDIDIIARTMEDLKESFTSIEKAAREMGLTINEDKTKILISTVSKSRVRRSGQRITVGDYNFEIVNIFKYLSTNIENENNISEEIKQRVVAASRCAQGLNKHLRSQYIGRETKIKIYRTLIKPVLTYACETWTLSNNDENLLGIFERKIFGGINEGGKWRRRYNSELYQLYNGHDIAAYIKVQRLRWAGHIQRTTEDYPPKEILNGRVYGNRRPGR